MIKLFIILLLLGVCVHTDSQKNEKGPKILHVSSLPQSVSNPVYSSLKGGRTIYIKIMGHSDSPSDNKVFVGNFPCPIASDGVSDTYITCVTSDSKSTVDISNLAVTVISKGASDVSQYPHVVTYTASYTSGIDAVFPSAGYANAKINVEGSDSGAQSYGVDRDTGDVELKLGDDVCNRYDDDKNPQSQNGKSALKCTQSDQQEAGTYNLTKALSAGYSSNNKNLRRSSLKVGEYFEFTTLPTVSSVSPNTGSMGGQEIKIKGSGFSRNKANDSVSVDGTDCRITEVAEDELSCVVAKRNNSLTKILVSNSSSPKYQYSSGSGVKYARYSFTGGLDLFVSRYRTNVSSLGTAIESSVKTEIREGDFNGYYYAEMWKGYFIAPVTGLYTFRGLSDESFSMYLANTYGSTELPSTPLISCYITQIWNDFYYNHCPAAEKAVTLQANKYYYLEAFHTSYYRPGYFNLEVDVPNNQSSLPFQSYQVDYIVMGAVVQPQVVVYSMIGGSKGLITLSIKRVDSKSGSVIYTASRTISYGCEAATFQNELNYFDGFYPYRISVERIIYDSDNNTMNTTVNCSRIDYVTSFYLLRPTSIQSETFKINSTNFTGTFKQYKLTPHSPLINGTWQLSIGGVNIDPFGKGSLPYSVDPGSLQAGIRTLVGFQKVEVSQFSPNSWGYGYESVWLIRYVDYFAQVPNLVINGAGLTGGKTSPTIQRQIKRNFSKNIIFDTDYRFLSTASNTPSVVVTVNNLTSVCLNNCGYTFQDPSRVTSVSLNSTNLTISISNPTNASINIDSISIKVQGHPCKIYKTSVLSSIICAIQADDDGSTDLMAGDIGLEVKVPPFGIIDLADNMTSISIPLVAASLSVTSAGKNGGYLMTISGSGFSSNKSLINVTICGSQVTIKKSTGTSIAFTAPACDNIGPQAIYLTIGSLTASNLNFTFINATSPPTIDSITPNTANPTIKGTLEVKGSGFGVNSTDIDVFLSNASGRVYELNVLSHNDTYIKVGRPGGLAGNYTLVVSLPNSTGNSVPTVLGADKFSYSQTITSITPTNGSYNGGTLLTITGTNISPTSPDTLVFVGDTLNWFCNIESINSTEIKCRTPAISDDYLPNVPVDVVVSSKLIALSTCTGSCIFTYLPKEMSPNLTSISSSSVYVQTLVVNGTNFNSTVNGSCEISLTSLDVVLTLVLPTIKCNSTTANFTITNTVPAGNYYVRVRNSMGESNPLPLTVGWSLGTISTSYASLEGSVIKFSGGSGYPAVIKGGYTINLETTTSSVSAKIQSCCTNNILQLVIPSTVVDTYFTIKYKSPATTSAISLGFYNQLAKTPVGSITSTKNVSQGQLTIQVNRTSTFSSTISNISIVSTLNDNVKVVVSNWTINSTFVSFTATLASGAYKLKLLTASGYYQIKDILNVFASNVTATSKTFSYAGGLFTVTGANLSEASHLYVNGYKAPISTYTTSAVTYSIPAFITQSSQSSLQLSEATQIDVGKLTYFSDQNASTSNVSSAFDGQSSTVYGSTNSNCWIGVDIGTGLAATINKIRFFPLIDWNIVGNYILEAEFQGSNDMTNWTKIAVVDQTVRSGYNTIFSLTTTSFRYIRFSHNSTSHCNIAQIQLYGVVYSTTASNLTSQFVTPYYQDGFNNVSFNNAIEFRQDKTPIVETISPPYGDVFGAYDLVMTGKNLGFGTPVILIDGIACTSPSYTNTSIVCTVGARPNLPASNSFSVIISGRVAIIRDSFIYVLKWSDSRTWGVDLPPITGDLVYVPKGMTLLVDQTTPVLEGIAVENGTLMFANNLNITVQTGFITLVGGRMIAGTEKDPITGKLNFIMHGGYYGKQQPIFGNKGIGCLQCKLSIYGAPRTPVWTTIASTISPGDTTFTVSENVDWKAGEKIVVAATGFYHTEAEQKTIVSVSNRTITVDTPFVYQHISVEQTYGTSDKLIMKAEVGLLTRNIKMMGDASSTNGKYGSHLMMAGKSVNGLQAKIAYTEFTNCGQSQIQGRYCIHYHLNGEIPTSYVKGNSVYESYSRVVSLHGVHFLTVDNNIGYRVRGHNFFLEDGIQTKNVIKNNLAISSLSATNMLQTDVAVASFWISNPTNDITGNHAAGGDFYGFAYEIRDSSNGPSASNDICPIGNPLGLSSGNVAHSNARFGLRIYKLYSRLYPCKDIRNTSNYINPWLSNPSKPSQFFNFTLFRNQQIGVLAEQTGNVIFNGFVVAEHVTGSIRFDLADFSGEPATVINSAMIGYSSSTSNSSKFSGTVGITTPRSGTTNLTNVNFYNYPTNSIALSICSVCDTFNIGTDIFTKKISFSQISGSYLYLQGYKRSIIYDTDGSISAAFDGLNRTSAAIISNFPHIAKYRATACPAALSPSQWDSAIMCGPTATVRRVVIGNIQNYWNFYYQSMKVKPLDSVEDFINSSSTLPYTSTYYTYSLPYLTNETYGVWWGPGVDFEHVEIQSTNLYTPQDDGIVFKFNYTLNRQYYRIKPTLGGVSLITQDYLTKNLNYSTPSSCINSEYYHNNDDNSLRMLTVCQSGKNKTVNQITQIDAVFCIFLCPPPPPDPNAPNNFIKEGFVRLWSNATQWPNATIPKPGENVTINGNWTVLLDIDPSPAAYLIIDGTLVADDTRDVNLTAHAIYIRAGNLSVGSANKPFMHRFTIQLNGLKEDHGYTVDDTIVGNKFLVVTGSLNLFGDTPATLSSFLTQTAYKNETIIHAAEFADWKVGDTLALSPSYNNPLEYEIVTIKQISTDGTIVLEEPLKFTHHGSYSMTLVNSYGSLDARTKLGHLTRNIKIVSGNDIGWGYNIIIYGVDIGKYRMVGTTTLSGVELINGGQYDTQSGPLTFLNSIGSKLTSLVTGSSFTNCKSFCINIENARKLTINSNTFVNGRTFGVQVKNAREFIFSSNIIIGITTRPSVGDAQMIACFALYDYIDPAEDIVTISNNYCLGSTGFGFAFPHIKCEELEYNPMANNTAGSCQIGFVFNKIDDDCQAFSYITAFACQIGQISGAPDSTALVYSHFMLADNGRGATLKFGSSQGVKNNTAVLKDSFITALSRPSCTDCYGSGYIDCSQNIAVRMLSVSAAGNTLPSYGSGFDSMGKQQAFDHKAFLYNVVFDYFRQNYTGVLSTACKNNFVFRPHSEAYDAVAGHNLFDCSCTNCDTSSYAKCDDNDPALKGWSGGCGDMVCTGKTNYIIQDNNGTFLPYKGIILPNNSDIAANEANCTYNPAMNGYLCKRQDFVNLAYQSIASDYKTRIMWPVNLTGDGQNYSTLTNGFRDWEWNGGIPLNRRYGRFNSLVKLNTTYNMTFASQPPIDMQFQIQTRVPDGNKQNYVIVKLHHPLPNSIRAQVGGVTLKPILLTDSGLKRALNTSLCGDNVYYYTNYTIKFVITEDPNCLVRISLTDSIQLTTHFVMNASDFFVPTVFSNFINNLCALLDIKDTSRVKVVGVYSGSAIIDTFIDPISTANVTSGGDPTMAATSAALNQAISDGTFAANMSTGVGYMVIKATSSLVMLPEESSPTETFIKANTAFVVGMAIVAVIVVVGLFIILIYCLKKKKNQTDIRESEEEFPQEKQIEKNVEYFVDIDISDSQVNIANIPHVPTREATPKKVNRRGKVRKARG